MSNQTLYEIFGDVINFAEAVGYLPTAIYVHYFKPRMMKRKTRKKKPGKKYFMFSFVGKRK